MVHLKDGIIYGPVSSRRLGRSLGINVLGAARKVCTFDCVYCQLRQPRAYAVDYDSGVAVCKANCHSCRFTQAAPGVDPGRHELPSVAEVLAAVEAAVRANPDLQSLTLSGNGEPTLYPRFGDLVDGLVALRDRLCPMTAVSVLSNASVAARPSVRRALRKLDVRIMKLDAGDEDTFRALNRPCPGVALAGVVEGLRRLGAFTLQTLFVGGRPGNASAEQVEAWLVEVARLRPERIQIYSLDRLPAEGELVKLSREWLSEVAARARAACGAEVGVY